MSFDLVSNDTLEERLTGDETRGHVGKVIWKLLLV